MSNIRKRHVRFSEDSKKGDGDNVIGFRRFRIAVEKLLLGNRKRKGKIQQIENSSIWPSLVAFVVFLVAAVYFVDYLHKWENGLLDDTVYQGHEYERRFIGVKCSKDYGNEFKNCSPKKCGRAVRDNLFEKDDVKYMKAIAEKGMKYGGGNGGATILDLHSGALSYGDKFVNIHAATKVFNQSDFDVYSKIRNKIQETIADEFGIDRNSLFLTKPTFFSRLTNKTASTKHDEYWHQHIDRVTYGTFFYTSLLYLSDYGIDFTGGRFMFVDNNINKTVEPKLGRLSFFTSGSENAHFVERVESGTRYAITVSFTCDRKHMIKDPSMQ